MSLLAGIFVLRAAAWAGEEEEWAVKLEAIRKAHALPALAAVAVIKDEIRAQAAVGIRKVDSPERVTLQDKWHIGSCTKSMTATVAAMLVEEGKMTWETKVGDILAEQRETMDPSWRAVTLEMLLAHLGGAPAEPPANLWRNAWARAGTPREQRAHFVHGLLLRRTQAKPGTKFIYSNQGYAIAGAMMERVAGKPWEELMQTMLFAPAHMTSAGFGAPASPGKVDQPWGHAGAELVPVPPGPAADNPPAIGPAGTVHCSLADLAHYGALHARGERGGTMFLQQAGFEKLHRASHGEEYALGWGVEARGWAGGDALMHAGSNTMFQVVIWIAPAKDAVFVAATTAAGKAAERGTDEAIAALLKLLE